MDVYILNKGKLKQLNKMTIYSPDENINSYDLDHYFLVSCTILLRRMITAIKASYTVRIYCFIEHDVGFKGEYVITWDNKIKFKPLFNEKQKTQSLRE